MSIRQPQKSHIFHSAGKKHTVAWYDFRMLGKNLFTDVAPAGKVTVAGTLIASLVFTSVLVSYFRVDVQPVHADDVTTSITVLNTPPTWTVDAEESTESSTSTPTNAGSVITWVGTGTDSSNDNYFMLICKTGSAPTAVASAPPTCNGGSANQWAISATTTSGSQASAATTTREYFPFANESNEWYAWICDANASLPRCNASYTRGNSTTAAPFVVNHAPYFNNISNSGPVDPLSNITWTSVSFDNDSLGSADTFTLYVCKAADFTGTYCGAGGSWATSSAATSNAATTTFITAPTRDNTYSAFVYIVDQHGLAATSSRQASNSSYVVNNVAPQVTTSTIALLDTDNTGSLTLTTSGGRTDNFKVSFTVTDNNSCLTATSSNEIVGIVTNVYRSGFGSTSCAVSGNFDSNKCYPSNSSFTNFSCSQTGGTCSGITDSSVDWICTFGLWYNADPTDASTQFPTNDWLATVRAYDDDAGFGPLVEASTGNELLSFLSFDVTSTTIPYGSLQPGDTHATLATSTDLIAKGNTGLDEDVYGDTMCTTWTVADSCDSNGVSALNDIPISNQKVATSAVAYGSAFAYTMTGSTSPTNVDVHVPKVTSTSSPTVKYTYWGISVPGTITTAGSYSGQNTITGKKSNASFW